VKHDGLKAVAFRAYRFALLTTLRFLLIADIGTHSCFIFMANRFGKVAISPEAFAPEELLKVRKLLPNYSA
ncbi:MAG TPA: hypothetical protein VGK19_00370, partial [Capsulimonadaceae bacterium]